MKESVLDYDAIERELRLFEAEERRRLGIEEEQVDHWHDPNPQVFGYHEIWHVCMTSAAFCHYVAVLLAVLAAR